MSSAIEDKEVLRDDREQPLTNARQSSELDSLGPILWPCFNTLAKFLSDGFLSAAYLSSSSMAA